MRVQVKKAGRKGHPPEDPDNRLMETKTIRERKLPLMNPLEFLVTLMLLLRTIRGLRMNAASSLLLRK